MLRIHRIYDDVVPANRERLKQVADILRRRIPDVPEKEVEQLGEKLRNPLKHRFKSILFVSESMRRRVTGFALMLHEPDIGFAWLDWLATASARPRGGLGAALYDRVRREAAAFKARGLFFECLPDDPAACPDTDKLKQNRSRLKFYEQYGARPVINTGFEMPVNPGETCMPHLVYDGLAHGTPLRRAFARKVVRAILERKYPEYCPREYVDRVVASFSDDPIRLREFVYVKPEVVISAPSKNAAEPIALIVNARHEIHHVHERGYVESPVRIRSILSVLERSGLFDRISPKTFPDAAILKVHDGQFFSYLKKACAQVPPGKSLYPYIFPIRNKTRPPKEPSVLSGYYCIDTFTPINANAFPAARGGVDCSLTAAREIIDGRRIAYALVRPPATTRRAGPSADSAISTTMPLPRSI